MGIIFINVYYFYSTIEFKVSFTMRKQVKTYWNFKECGSMESEEQHIKSIRAKQVEETYMIRNKDSNASSPSIKEHDCHKSLKDKYSN